MDDSGTPEISGLNVLVLEPYYGGSHRSFLENMSTLPFNFHFMTLPARNWKWRMRLAAPLFAQQLHDSGERYDRILCSSYLDVAAFRGLAPVWTREVPLLTYFHENQFAYPVQVHDSRDAHFALTNITTALASDKLAFNSRFNLDSFLDGAEKLMRQSPDLNLADARKEIVNKSVVLFPGIDFSPLDEGDLPERDNAPVILWNHRWEHDKNPELFFNTMFHLDKEGYDFSLVLLGQSFNDVPPIFNRAKNDLSHRILHCGYAQTSRDYSYWIRKSDFVISTASHEFFGIAVAEAVYGGCRPLLPNRLSYPELFPKEYLYSDEELVGRLKEYILDKKRLTRAEAVKLTSPYSRETLSPAYTSWIKNEE